MTGDDVKQLQVYLVSKGYDIGTPDGVYGTKSSIAIAKFQRENNLKPDGALGPVTRGLLFK
jgi:N-acetylmuramoyl-L-alanine amidase